MYKKMYNHNHALTKYCYHLYLPHIFTKYIYHLYLPYIFTIYIYHIYLPSTYIYHLYLPNIFCTVSHTFQTIWVLGFIIFLQLIVFRNWILNTYALLEKLTKCWPSCLICSNKSELCCGDPNTLHLDPDPEFWPHLEPDPDFREKTN